MTFPAFTIQFNKIANTLKSKVTVLCNEDAESFYALWDTGATISCISHDVVQRLKLVPTGKMPIHTPSGQSICNTYLVDILLPNNVLVKDNQVCESEIGGQGLGVLIGMNIITQGDFSVSNFQGKTTFTFRIPSVKETDFVKEAQMQTITGTHGPGKRKKKKH